MHKEKGRKTTTYMDLIEVNIPKSLPRSPPKLAALITLKHNIYKTIKKFIRELYIINSKNGNQQKRSEKKDSHTLTVSRKHYIERLATLRHMGLPQTEPTQVVRENPGKSISY